MTDLPSDTEPSATPSTIGTGAWRERRLTRGTVYDRFNDRNNRVRADWPATTSTARSEADLLAAILTELQAIRAHLARNDRSA